MDKLASLFAVIALLLTLVTSTFGQRKLQLEGKTAAGRENVKRRTEPPPLSPTAQFSSTSAKAGLNGVLIEWSMAFEKGNLGFDVYRITSKDRVKVNAELIFGSVAKTGEQPLYGESYSVLDRRGGVGSVYQIETLSLEGRRSMGPTFSPVYVGLRFSDDSKKSNGAVLNESYLDVPQEVINDIKSNTRESFAISGEANIDTHRWVLTQPGVRIGVKRHGLYRVTRPQLETGGFNVNSDPAFWQLYLNGIEQAIIVEPSGEYLEFIGKGEDTPETDVRNYFLINGPGPGLRMSESVARPSLGTIAMTGYEQTFEFRERLASNYINTILNGDEENFWGRFIGSAGTDITFDLSGIDLTDVDAVLEVKVQGLSQTTHSLSITLNGQQLQSAQGVAQFPYAKSQTIPTSLLKDASLGQGTNTLNLAAVGPSGDSNLFDRFRISFRRKFRASQNTLNAYSAGQRIARLTGFSSANTRVFETSLENVPRLITNLTFQQQPDLTYGVDLPANRGRIFFAVEESVILSPDFISPFDNELLGVNTHEAELIIISHNNFLTEAEAWADYRRGQGFRVKVVEVEAIYNEFNFGTKRADTMRDFLSYAHANWLVPPQYALIIGDAHFDQRGYGAQGVNNFVSTRMVTTVFRETGSDETLADFNDDGLSELAIGRIPARTPAMVANALAKVVNWEANLTGSLDERGALFAYDLPDGFNDFQGMSENLRDELPAETPIVMISRGQTDAQTELLAGLNNLVDDVNRGRFIVNYSGHGSATAWNNTGFFWNGTVPSLTNANNETIFTMLTCLNGDFVGSITSLSETLLNSSTGGSVASWASTGLTTADDQEVMGTRFYNQLGAGNIQRLGDLIKDAKTAVDAGPDVRLSWALIGDPMLKVH